MSKQILSRRAVIAGATGAIGIAALGGARQGRAATAKLDLNDPLQRARVRAKIIGSAAEETVYALYRLNIYGYMNDGNLLPFFTMNNLNVGRWQPLPDGNYRCTTWESGTYCRFDTDEVLDEWDNPITGERRRVWDFLGGPFNAEFGADGVIVRGAELQPKALRMETLGDMVFIQTAADFSMPNPLTPAQWPTQSSGPIRYWDSHYTFAAKLADVANPRSVNSPAFCQFQNLGSWHPWLGMGNRPGRTYGKAYGTKLKSLDALPKLVRAGFEKKTPEIFDLDNWKSPRLELLEYMKAHQPG